jgi:hypothetical protein
MRQFRNTQDDSFHQRALRTLRRRWKVVVPLLLVLVVSMTVIVLEGMRFYAEQQIAEVAQTMRRYREHRLEAILEGSPSALSKEMSITEDGELSFQKPPKFTGYGIRLDNTYIGATGDPVPLQYSPGKLVINEKEIPLALSPLSSAFSTLGHQNKNGKEPLLQMGENSFEISYTVKGLPLQSENGRETLRWTFPRSHRLALVDSAKAIFVLPPYAQRSETKAHVTIGKYRPELKKNALSEIARIRERTAPPPQFQDSFLKGKKRVTIVFHAQDLASFEALDIEISW